MANTTSPGRRTMTAAARAAAKRARRAEQLKQRTPEPEEGTSGRTVVIEVPDGWDDPPEPSPEGPEAEASAPPSRRWLLTVALGALLVVLLGASALLGWRYVQGGRTEDARGQALTAARRAAPVVLSYDYRHLDRDFANARAHLTGHFRDQYGKTTGAVVGPTARKYHGVVRATVPAASVVSAAPGKVVVLLFVNQVTESTQVQGSRLDLNRVRMTMTRTSGGWKVSAVDAL